MSVYYDGSHSVTFYYTDDGSYYKKNTWDDFHLIPASRPYVIAPSPNIQLVTLPRSNNVLDLTNSLSRDLIYNAREGDWEFYVDHDQWNSWMDAFDTVSDIINGRVFKIILEDQPDIRYTGRLNVASYNPGGDYSRLAIHYNIDVIEEEVDDGEDSGGSSDPADMYRTLILSGDLYDMYSGNNVFDTSNNRYRCCSTIRLASGTSYPFTIDVKLYALEKYTSMDLWLVQLSDDITSGNSNTGHSYHFTKVGRPTLMEDGRYEIKYTLYRSGSSQLTRKETYIWIGQKEYEDYQQGGSNQQLISFINIDQDESEYKVYLS